MTSPVHVEESVQISRPPAEVWEAIADYSFDLQWRNGLLEMTPDPPGPPAAGKKVHEVVRSSGRTTFPIRWSLTWIRASRIDSRARERSGDSPGDGRFGPARPARARCSRTRSSSSRRAACASCARFSALWSVRPEEGPEAAQGAARQWSIGVPILRDVAARRSEQHLERWGDDPKLVALLGERRAEGFRALFDGFPEAVGVLWPLRDEDGRIVDFAFGYGNPSMLRGFRLPAATRDRYTLLEALPRLSVTCVRPLRPRLRHRGGLGRGDHLRHAVR